MGEGEVGLGGGVLDSFGSPTFAGCTFVNNGAELAGGGLYDAAGRLVRTLSLGTQDGQKSGLILVR